MPPDDESSEGYFDLHTPSIGATKWWIGGAGETATHATVYARLVTKGVDYGVHVFIVQLRDMDTHKPLDGVHVGDVGGKMGRDGIDNGYIQFHHYRAPSSSLLCKYAQVSRDGTYVRQPKAQPQLAYGALIQGRAHMVQDSASVLSVAATIAIRWAIARRQGAPFRKEKKEESTDGAAERPSPGSEPQIMDYTTHQNKLLSLVATAYAFTFTAHRMKEMYENVRDQNRCYTLVYRLDEPLVCAVDEWDGKRRCFAAAGCARNISGIEGFHHLGDPLRHRHMSAGVWRSRLLLIQPPAPVVCGFCSNVHMGR